MSRKKEVTIGITVNLENYENLRLEVSGDAETCEDVEDLIAFLDGMLARLGRGDPATTERVDAYRRRVLALRPAKPQTPAPSQELTVKTAESMAPTPAEGGEAQQKIEETSPAPGVTEAMAPPAPKRSKPVIESQKQPEPQQVPEPVIKSTKQPEPQQAPEPVIESQKQPEPQQAPEPVIESQKQPEPQQEPELDEAKPPVTQAEDTCEICGAEVTKSQAKLSKLFMNKTLCKKCMEQP